MLAIKPSYLGRGYYDIENPSHKDYPGMNYPTISIRPDSTVRIVQMDGAYWLEIETIDGDKSQEWLAGSQTRADKYFAQIQEAVDSLPR